MYECVTRGSDLDSVSGRNNLIRTSLVQRKNIVLIVCVLLPTDLGHRPYASESRRHALLVPLGTGGR